MIYELTHVHLYLVHQTCIINCCVLVLPAIITLCSYILIHRIQLVWFAAIIIAYLVSQTAAQRPCLSPILVQGAVYQMALLPAALVLAMTFDFHNLLVLDK